MERIALEDERKKSLGLQDQLEVSKDAAKEVAAKEKAEREARVAAEKELSKALARAGGLAGLSGPDAKQAAEARLAVLLAEQRATLEAANQKYRTESSKQMGEMRVERKKLEKRIAELEHRLRTWRPPSPEGGDSRTRLTSDGFEGFNEIVKVAPTKFKAFTFSSDRRAEEKKRLAEAAKEAEEAEKREKQERQLRAVLAKLEASPSLLKRRKSAEGAHPPVGLSPDMKHRWYVERDRMLQEVAATKLQAAYRGRKARRSVTERATGARSRSPRGKDSPDSRRSASQEREDREGADVEDTFAMATPKRRSSVR